MSTHTPLRQPKTGQLNLRISPDLKALAERAAADDHRSLANLIEKLLIGYLRAEGYMKKTPGRK